MQIYQVRLFPNGPGNDELQPYRKVAAETAKGAAERLYGEALYETGSLHQFRALVHRLSGPRGTPSTFYAR